MMLLLFSNVIPSLCIIIQQCIVRCVNADWCAVFRMWVCVITPLSPTWCGEHTLYGVFYTPAVVCSTLLIKGCVLHTPQGVLNDTAVAHLIWCAVHTFVFTVYCSRESISPVQLNRVCN